MAQPRFLFVAGVAAARSGWVHWPSEADVPGEAGADGSWVGWRLAGGNNRELGRSATVFADLAACRAAATALQQQIDRTRRLASVNDSTGLWGWRLDLAGQPVATAGRLYLRQRECQYSLAQFAAAVPQARLSGHVVYLSRGGGGKSDPVPRPRAAEFCRPVPARPDGAMSGLR